MNRPLDNLVERAASLVGTSRTDAERLIRQMVDSALNRMDLVTREEFDAQTRVLERTREHLDALEARVAELEQQQTD